MLAHHLHAPTQRSTSSSDPKPSTMLRQFARKALHGVVEAPFTVLAPQSASALASPARRFVSPEPARTQQPQAASDFSSITIGQVMKQKAESGSPTAALFWAKPEVRTMQRLADSHPSCRHVTMASTPRVHAHPNPGTLQTPPQRVLLLPHVVGSTAARPCACLLRLAQHHLGCRAGHQASHVSAE